MLLVALAAGCGGSATLATTRLTLTAVNPGVGRAVFNLDCQPAGGDVADPVAACRALARNRKLVTTATPFPCGGFAGGGCFELAIDGRLSTGSRCTESSGPSGLTGLRRSPSSGSGSRSPGTSSPPGGASSSPARRVSSLPVRFGSATSSHARSRGTTSSSTFKDRVGSIGSEGISGYMNGENMDVELTGTRRADGSITASCELEEENTCDRVVDERLARLEPERGIDPAGRFHLRQRVEAHDRVAELARAVDRRSRRAACRGPVPRAAGRT